MNILRKFFSGTEGPSEGQIRRAIKQVTQTHGEAGTRVAALERLASWRTEEAAAALLRRFTIQVPQASMDLEEKQYTVRLLSEMGSAAVPPILNFIRSEPDVTHPLSALRALLSSEEYHAALKGLLENFSKSYTRWPEAKAVLLEHLEGDAFPLMWEIVLGFLEDEDDDVCIAAIDYLARNGDEKIREKLIELYLSADSRPRVRGRILDALCEHEWPVKGYRKKMEEVIAEPFYLTAKGTVKRRT
jgi:HEAT repeat protein